MEWFGILKDRKLVITMSIDFVDIQNQFHNLLSVKNNNPVSCQSLYELVKIEIVEGEN